MSLKIIKGQIDNFLKEENPEVMAVKGDWGVGKTFTWNKYLLEAKNNNKCCLSKYSYVSLFGVDSLDSFKYSIFENLIDRNIIGTDANVETFKRNASDLLTSFGRKSVRHIKGASFLKNFSPAIESLSFLSLEKTLICIDDLERKGKGLSIKDVLGLVSLLKEQKRCKIVILLNDGEDGLEDYIKYREKVIDTELRFNPTAEECASIAYEKDGYEFDTLKSLSPRLDIRNIRVLKKIERVLDLSIPMLDGLEDEVKYQVVHSLTLFSWCYYCSNANDEIPSLDFVTNSGYSLLGIGGDKQEDTKEKKWKTIIHDYGYQLTDEFDLVLAEAVKTGYFVEDEFRRGASKKNEEVVASKSEGSFSDAWKLYHDSFDNNAEEVVNGLYDSFNKNVKNISLTNLNGTVTLFRELDEHTKASEIIDTYIRERMDETSIFNLKENNFFGDVRDPEIVSKFDEIYEKSVNTENASQVLSRIAGKNGWNQADEVILANTSVDDYYELFKSEKGKHLTSYVNACLQFGKFSDSSEQQARIATNATEALKRIASESEINRRRVRKFSIEV